MSLWRNIIFTLVAVVSTVGVCRAQQGDYERYARFLNEQDYSSRQMEMGVTIGASYMGLDSSMDAVVLSPKMGVRAALEMSLLWDHKYALQMEVAYVANKVDVALGKRELGLKSSIVEVPLIFSYRGREWCCYLWRRADMIPSSRDWSSVRCVRWWGMWQMWA